VIPDKYDKYYCDPDNALVTAFKEVVAFCENLELGQTVLDVRVGQGQDAIPLAQMGHRVIRIDLSSVGIEKLKNTTALQRLNIDAQVADLCTSSPTRAVGHYPVRRHASHDYGYY
jgi:2-polyprenyl-3-methyl-5-hydroxy-6-metoxy-1,4-benzoquinol methylase